MERDTWQKSWQLGKRENVGAEGKLRWRSEGAIYCLLKECQYRFAVAFLAASNWWRGPDHRTILCRRNWVRLYSPFESPSRHVIFDSMATPRLTFETVGSEFSTELSLAAFALSAPGATRRSIIVV